ncbi:MAG: molybdenum cofactor guanylyltransferase [Blastocatellia bacterium]
MAPWRCPVALDAAVVAMVSVFRHFPYKRMPLTDFAETLVPETATNVDFAAPDPGRETTAPLLTPAQPKNRPPRIFIQAGGRSSRMGADKAWATLRDRPLIEHVIAAAAGVSDNITVVINPLNPARQRYAALTARRAATARASNVADDLYQDCGPLGGIYTALTLLQPGEAALMLACDTPFLSAAFLRLLWEQHQTHGAALTIPLDAGNRAQMLTGVYTTACRPHIARMLAWREYKVDRLPLRVPARFVTYREYQALPEARRLLVNLNTPADLRQHDA